MLRFGRFTEHLLGAVPVPELPVFGAAFGLPDFVGELADTGFAEGHYVVLGGHTFLFLKEQSRGTLRNEAGCPVAQPGARRRADFLVAESACCLMLLKVPGMDHFV